MDKSMVKIMEENSFTRYFLFFLYNDIFYEKNGLAFGSLSVNRNFLQVEKGELFGKVSEYAELLMHHSPQAKGRYQSLVMTFFR